MHHATMILENRALCISLHTVFEKIIAGGQQGIYKHRLLLTGYTVTDMLKHISPEGELRDLVPTWMVFPC